MTGREASLEGDPSACTCRTASDDAAPAPAGSELSRRRFLSRGLAGTAAGGLVAGGVVAGGLALAPPAAAQTRMTAAQALQELKDGNKRYVDGRMTSFAKDLDILHDKTAETQQPFGAVLSCADSRVPVELVFDQTIGRLFVCRVAGNITTPEIVASLEYGAQVLGLRVILVLAHGNCGAVQAAIGLQTVPGQISALYAPLIPAVTEAGPDLNKTAMANARIHAGLLRHASPVLAALLRQPDRLKIVAGFYDLATGQVTFME